MKNNISTVIFDYGCVISHPQSEESLARIMARLSVADKEEFRQHYLRHRAELDAGRLTGFQYWKLTTQGMGLKLPDDAIQWLVMEDIRSWTEINGDMLNLISWLHQQHYTLVILSNMTSETLTYIRGRDSWHHIFDNSFFSCDLGMVKPEPGIYRYVLDKLKVRGENCLFIDDTYANCIAAEQFGIHAFYYTDLQRLRAFMVAKGIDMAEIQEAPGS